MTFDGLTVVFHQQVAVVVAWRGDGIQDWIQNHPRVEFGEARRGYAVSLRFRSSSVPFLFLHADQDPRPLLTQPEQHQGASGTGSDVSSQIERRKSSSEHSTMTRTTDMSGFPWLRNASRFAIVD